MTVRASKSLAEPALHIHGMVKDTNNPDGVAVDVVENAVAAVRQATDRRIDLGPQGTGEGMAPEQIKS